MKKGLVLSIIILFTLTVSVGFAQQTEPMRNKGKKWRIGYLEGGSFYNYPPNLTAFVLSLADAGWLRRLTIPPQKNEADAKAIWNWLAANVKSRYLEFPKDAFYSSNWDSNLRIAQKKELIKRLKIKHDIDLMIAMGTWAGQDLANNEHNVPTMVFSSSDPIRSNIIKSAKDSGFSHVHARIDPTRYERQVRLFHDIIGFRTLGVVYEDSFEGRTYAAVNDIEKVANEQGFKIVRCFSKNQVPNIKTANDSVVKCHKELALKVDAVYITNQTGINIKNMERLLAPLLKYKIPTFSQIGSRDVIYGVLMCVAQANFRYVGKYHAEVAARIFNGAAPGSLNQVFEDPPKISINLATAAIIGYEPPVDILGAADEIYQDIKKVK
ncbi:MAG: ABC transporter substrate-binding protein [Desulfobacteraceae bacterium]|nr:ABC transporter substrate-binding protein [Desulfobacteraceae bacterium]